MNLQTQINFDIIPNGIVRIHERENNAESENILNENLKHFTKQCQTVLTLLKSGIRLTRIGAATKYNILSLERRCADLRQAGVDVKTEWVTNETGKKLFKEYFL